MILEDANCEAMNGEFLDDIEFLPWRECLRLLTEGSVGCLGLPSVGHPELRPVNYVVEGSAVIIRTGEGQILDAGRHGLSASMQVFDIDAVEHTGWSVQIGGKLSELETCSRTLSLPLRPWASGRKNRFVKLSFREISGRRIQPGRGNR
jgi:nitroimidazol reductase NimA-like FMN-containing flavoprotein (pyridoxamine 5'-phosphate oxidase superfamily)